MRGTFMLPALHEAFANSHDLRLVISDFSTFAGPHFAEERGLPCVINVPGSLEMVQLAGIVAYPNLVQRLLFVFIQKMQYLLLPPAPRVFLQHLANQKHSTFLINSSFGIEQPCSLPPTVLLTGPLFNPQTQLESELASWMQQKADVGVVYVSTGSIARLSMPQIQAIRDGLLRSGHAVLWSLHKEDHVFVAGSKGHHFRVHAWLPQSAVLQHPSVRMAICHCGWSGLLECCAGAVPVVALPLFADQLGNAEKVERLGIGVKLPMANLTAESILEAAIEVATNSKYYKAVSAAQDSLSESTPQQAYMRIEKLVVRDKDGAWMSRQQVVPWEFSCLLKVSLLFLLAFVAWAYEQSFLGPFIA